MGPAAAITQLPGERNSTVPITTCNRNRNTNGLVMPPLKCNCSVSEATSTSRPARIAAFETCPRRFHQTWLARLNRASSNSTPSIQRSGSAMPMP